MLRARPFSCSIQTPNCGMWDLVPQSRVKPGSRIFEAQSLSHWTTREVPIPFLFIASLIMLLLLCAQNYKILLLCCLSSPSLTIMLFSPVSFHHTAQKGQVSWSSAQWFGLGGWDDKGVRIAQSWGTGSMADAGGQGQGWEVPPQKPGDWE